MRPPIRKSGLFESVVTGSTLPLTVTGAMLSIASASR